MKVIILASVVLAISGCSSTDNVSFGAKRAYSYNFINDGSQKAEKCQLECQKKETQCKQLAAIEYQASVASNPEWWEFDIARHIKETRDEQCENDTIACISKICHGSVEKHFLD